jgi:hypothetical protein
MLFAGLVTLIMTLSVSSSAAVVTGPLLLAGLGIGALASQLGAVTVSSVPDSFSGEVGGLQNTVTNLGASVGTALAGAVLISALTASFISGVQNNPQVPESVKTQATTQLSSGVPFVSNAQLETALLTAGVDQSTTDEIVKVNESARIQGLQSALAVLAGGTLIAFVASRRLPTKPVSSASGDEDEPTEE